MADASTSESSKRHYVVVDWWDFIPLHPLWCSPYPYSRETSTQHSILPMRLSVTLLNTTRVYSNWGRGKRHSDPSLAKIHRLETVHLGTLWNLRVLGHKFHYPPIYIIDFTVSPKPVTRSAPFKLKKGHSFVFGFSFLAIPKKMLL